jgi:hypothetical protein
MPSDAIKELDWPVEFLDNAKNRYRRPRPPWNKIERLLLRALSTRVSLEEQDDHTRIVLTFPTSTQTLPKRIQKIHSDFGMKIEDVFYEVLWRDPKKNSSTLWSRLVRTAYRAYCDTWLHFEELLYLDHSHPEADTQLRAELLALRKKTNRRAGRRQVLREEELSLKRRFEELLADCNEIYGIVQACAEKGLAEAQIRKEVYAKVHGRRIEKDVLSKNRHFWNAIAARKKQDAYLHRPKSWKSRGLAIALLAKERQRAYQTIEKKIGSARNRA